MRPLKTECKTDRSLLLPKTKRAARTPQTQAAAVRDAYQRRLNTHDGCAGDDVGWTRLYLERKLYST